MNASRKKELLALSNFSKKVNFVEHFELPPQP